MQIIPHGGKKLTFHELRGGPGLWFGDSYRGFLNPRFRQGR